MAPTIPEGAYVLLRAYGDRHRPQIGDVCMLRAAHGRKMIKRLIRQAGEGLFAVRGDGPLSAPGIDLGPAVEQDMVGCVTLTLRPHGEGAPDKYILT